MPPEVLLRQEHPKHNVDECGLDLGTTALQASNGDGFSFEAVIGDARDIEQLWSPYERGFVTGNCEQVD
jgi:hypothetical protein